MHWDKHFLCADNCNNIIFNATKSILREVLTAHSMRNIWTAKFRNCAATSKVVYYSQFPKFKSCEDHCTIWSILNLGTSAAHFKASAASKVFHLSSCSFVWNCDRSAQRNILYFTMTSRDENEESLKKSASMREFDELYLMDNLKLTSGDGTDSKPNPKNSKGATPTGLSNMAGSTYPRANNINSNSSGDGRRKSQISPQVHTFSDCDTSTFQLRVGPNYAKTGAKAPAGQSLYEVVGIE